MSKNESATNPLKIQSEQTCNAAIRNGEQANRSYANHGVDIEVQAEFMPFVNEQIGDSYACGVRWVLNEAQTSFDPTCGRDPKTCFGTVVIKEVLAGLNTPESIDI